MQKVKTNILTIALLIIVGVLLGISTLASAQVSLPNRSLQISDSRANQPGVEYIVGFNVPDAGQTIGSVRLRFCENSPLIQLPCDPIPGFDPTNANIVNQTGITGFSIAPGATQNELIFTRTPDVVTPGDNSITLNPITNPQDIGTHFGRLEVFSSSDATGTALYEGGVTFSINNPINLSTVVPPYLSLCVAVTLPGYLCSGADGYLVDVGELSRTGTAAGTSQFLVATNAGAGFVVYVVGNPPTAGTNIINPMPVTGPSVPGTSQFGMNLRDNSNPNIGQDPIGVGSGVIAPSYNVPNQFKYASGDALVSSNTTTADRKFTVSYIMNASKNQRPGIYNTILLYTALATF
jgi:hypothetical protein